MKYEDKLNDIQEKHLGQWLKTRQEISNKLSDANPMFCFCGRLATGLHEMNCRKFHDKVNRETVKELEHLLMEASK